MVQIAIKDNSKVAKAFLEYVKTLPFVQIVEDNIPNSKTLKAMKRAKSGDTIKTSGVNDLLKQLED